MRPHGVGLAIPPSPDESIVVGLRGGQALEVHAPGRTRLTEYRPGSVGLTPAGEGLLLTRRPARMSASFEKINLYLPARTLIEAEEELRPPGARPLYPSRRPGPWHDPTLLTTALSLLAAARNGVPDLYAATAAQWLCVHLLTAQGDRAPSIERTASTTAERGIEAAVELIRANFALSLTLDELARTARLSKFHFARAFRRSTGYPPHAYLVRTRLTAAASLLLDTDLAIRDVAHRCGFNRVESFERAFFKVVGSTAATYRLTRDPAPQSLIPRHRQP